LYLRNESEVVIGGILGVTYCLCFQIENFWIAEEQRGNGYGKLLITEAEKTAIKYGCTFSFTGTFSYQAPDFYKKMG
jgi:GNAT superfamily N-acetyltransferase